MLQNRVNPLGDIIKTKARGSWMGNRGILHNDNQEIIRFFKLNAWLTCKLQFKGRKRKIMAPNRYNELFFLDEATSFAAGHRPCFECRRRDFNKFKSLWLMGNPEYNFDEKTSIREIDKVLHKERINRNGLKITFEENIKKIPNGSFILYQDAPHLFLNGLFYLWSPFGYATGVLPNDDKLTVLTPKSVVNAFRMGYLPQMDISAN